MEFHQLASMFPMLEGEPFADLVEDVRAYGVREPIIIYEGQILDGRNRYRAAQEAGVECVQEFYRGDDPLAFVVSLNLKRRHLNESQRAMIAARIANIPCGANQHTLGEGTQIPIPSAAKLLNVSPALVSEAKTVLSEGTPEEVSSVESGVASANALGRQIRARRPEKPKKPVQLSQTGRNPERIQNQQIKAQIWGHVRDGLVALTSLPAPEDVVAIARAADKTGLVDARLSPAIKWLEGFSHAWTRNGKDQT